MSQDEKKNEATTESKPLVSSNPAMVEFPRDQWGMTSELRKVALRTVASIRGNKEKHALFVATLRVIAQHAAARLPVDAKAVADRVARLDGIESGKAAARVYTNGVPTPEA